MTGAGDEQSDLEREAAGLPPRPRIHGEGPTFTPPEPVRLSVLLWVAAAVVLAVGFLFMVFDKNDIVAALIESNDDPRVTEDQIANGTSAVLWTLAVGGMMFSVLFALFAYKAREGTRSARAVLAVLTVSMIVFVILAWPFMNYIVVLALALAVVATVLMYLPSVSGYFPPLPRAARRWRGTP